MKIKLNIEYDGTKFFGWQKQKSRNTVQETIETAIKKVFGNNDDEEVILYGAGRTDTGVHATNQVAHINISSPRNIDRWRAAADKFSMAINFYLHDTGAIVKSTELVDENFHARFSAKQREYLYIIYNRCCDSVILKNRVWHVKEKLDIDLMNDAAKLFVGTHNFNAFRSSHCQAQNPIRTLDYMHVYSDDNDCIMINVKARSFLHNQVRIMVGTLKQIGSNNASNTNIQKLFDSGDRTKGFVTAPPYGLYLKNVTY